jgi:hypothetical protein
MREEEPPKGLRGLDGWDRRLVSKRTKVGRVDKKIKYNKKKKNRPKIGRKRKGGRRRDGKKG